MGQRSSTLNIRYVASPLLKRLMGKASIAPKTGDAGIDLYAAIENPEPIGGQRRKRIPTGLRVVIPEGYVGLVKTRSSASEWFMEIAGVIDSSYTGEISAVIYNHTNDLIYIQPGERLTQLLIMPAPVLSFTEITQEELPVTERGEKGFGQRTNHVKR